MMNQWDLEALILRGLQEDVTDRDIACELLISPSQRSEATLIAKQPGVLAGTEVFEAVFRRVDPGITVQFSAKDGAWVEKGQVLATLEGPTRGILTGERLALNFLQRLSGIATLTRAYCTAIEGLNVRIADTRKTTPTLRTLEKYAVTVGGGYNHRFNLSDALMIKDNHIAAVGSIAAAVAAARKGIPHTMTVEVEAKDLDEVDEALAAGADIIMLDNMSLDAMRTAVQRIGSRAVTEASGGVNLETVRDIALTGVDVISVGALTHSYRSLDISLLVK